MEEGSPEEKENEDLGVVEDALDAEVDPYQAYDDTVPYTAAEEDDEDVVITGITTHTTSDVNPTKVDSLRLELLKLHQAISQHRLTRTQVGLKEAFNS